MKPKYYFIVSTFFSLLLFACNKKIIPDKPFLERSEFKIDSLPESEINIPIQVNMNPLYSMAEKNIATTFTSSNWPDDWINIDCANRYKYQFRRSKLQFTGSGTSMNIGFTGFYKIIGSTRACVGNTVISPWTPPCRCGFDEGERKVKVGFASSFSFLPDYKINFKISTLDPAPIDKCTVCFFGADITNQVMKGLKDELDLAKKAIEDSFAVVDIKPQIQQIWNRLNTAYNVYGLGWLKINPQRIKLNNLSIRNDSLNVSLGLTAKPVISFERPAEFMTLVPDINNATSKQGFNIFLDAVLNYDSLSNIVNAHLKGQQFNFNKGKIRKTFIVDDCRLYGSGNEQIIIKLKFSGTNEGIAYFTGKPIYDDSKKIFEIKEIDFDVKTRNLLLRSADWLFNKKITTEINKATRFDLKNYIDTAKTIIDQQLNAEWIKGINSSGKINDLKISGFYPMTEHLIIRSNASGSLFIKIDSINPAF